MNNFYLLGACLFGFVITTHAVEHVNPGCLEKEKALALLETAETFLTKAELSFPSCKEDVKASNDSECAGKKPLAYIGISKMLISDVRQNFPTCSKPIEKDDKIVEEVKPSDCSEILASGRNNSGVYTIWTNDSFTTGKSLQVYCDMKTDNGGWMVIQRRGKFPVQQDFDRDWESYKNGFGNMTQEFWLGNENIRVLCHTGCKIRFDLVDKNGEKGFALYQNFNLSNKNYRINISDYTGNVGDGMQFHNNFDFSTKDGGGNSSRAKEKRGGWWYNDDSSIFCNLNGIYEPERSSFENVHWYQWRNFQNLAFVEMKIKRK